MLINTYAGKRNMAVSQVPSRFTTLLERVFNPSAFPGAYLFAIYQATIKLNIMYCNWAPSRVLIYISLSLSLSMYSIRCIAYFLPPPPTPSPQQTPFLGKLLDTVYQNMRFLRGMVYLVASIDIGNVGWLQGLRNALLLEHT